jgi:putative CocE/NonD family hydrolase
LARLRDWPPPEATPTPFYLHSNGRANSAFGDGRLDAAPPAAEPADRFTYDPLAPVASLGGQSCCYPEISPMGPVDQGAAEQWNSVLVYTSDPLERDLLLVGDAAVTLFAASSARDTDWTARLCTVDPAGRSVNLKAGIVRARFRDGTAAPSLIEPHRVYEYAISLGPIGVRVPAGHSIRLSVSSSDFPHWDRNLNSGGPLFSEGFGEAVVATQTVLHDAARPSRLVLPVIEEDAE